MSRILDRLNFLVASTFGVSDTSPAVITILPWIIVEETDKPLVFDLHQFPQDIISNWFNVRAVTSNFHKIMILESKFWRMTNLVFDLHQFPQDIISEWFNIRAVSFHKTNRIIKIRFSEGVKYLRYWRGNQVIVKYSVRLLCSYWNCLHKCYYGSNRFSFKRTKISSSGKLECYGLFNISKRNNMYLYSKSPSINNM